ncbi:MAG TPA: hypothetical protein VNF47_28005 [Streptosporangiaceae bacterium]|nr:hypothetical protein [Streptosporangiaceae bacterium]
MRTCATFYRLVRSLEGGRHTFGPAVRRRSNASRPVAPFNTLFYQYVAGYTGSDVTRRGRDVAAGTAWTLPQLQDLLNEWIVAGRPGRTRGCAALTCLAGS